PAAPSSPNLLPPPKQESLFARLLNPFFDSIGHERRPLDKRRPVNFRYAPLATEDAWRCNMSRRAMSGRLAGLYSRAASAATLTILRLHNYGSLHPRMQPAMISKRAGFFRSKTEACLGLHIARIK